MMRVWADGGCTVKLEQCLMMCASTLAAEPERLPCCVDADMPGVSAKVEADVQQAAALPPLVLRGAGKQQLPALSAGGVRASGGPCRAHTAWFASTHLCNRVRCYELQLYSEEPCEEAASLADVAASVGNKVGSAAPSVYCPGFQDNLKVIEPQAGQHAASMVSHECRLCFHACISGCICG